MVQEVYVHYRRMTLLGIPSPFSHTYLEINKGGKKEYFGFYDKSHKSGKESFFWSLFKFVEGGVYREELVGDGGILVTKDSKKVKLVIKNIKNIKWKKYHALKRNCFSWRNEVLKKSGLKIPKDSFWKKMKKY